MICFIWRVKIISVQNAHDEPLDEHSKWNVGTLTQTIYFVTVAIFYSQEGLYQNLQNGEMPYFCGEKISFAWTVPTEKEDISGDSFAKNSDSTESLISKKFLNFYL